MVKGDLEALQKKAKSLRTTCDFGQWIIHLWFSEGLELLHSLSKVVIDTFFVFFITWKASAHHAAPNPFLATIAIILQWSFQKVLQELNNLCKEHQPAVSEEITIKAKQKQCVEFSDWSQNASSTSLVADFYFYHGTTGAKSPDLLPAISVIEFL